MARWQHVVGQKTNPANSPTPCRSHSPRETVTGQDKHEHPGWSLACGRKPAGPPAGWAISICSLSYFAPLFQKQAEQTKLCTWPVKQTWKRWFTVPCSLKAEGWGRYLYLPEAEDIRLPLDLFSLAGVRKLKPCKQGTFPIYQTACHFWLPWLTLLIQ